MRKRSTASSSSSSSLSSSSEPSLKRKRKNGSSWFQLAETFLEWKALDYLVMRRSGQISHEMIDIVEEDWERYESQVASRVLPLRYENVEEYQSLWEPLILLELREQLLHDCLHAIVRVNERPHHQKNISFYHTVKFVLPRDLVQQYDRKMVGMIQEHEMAFESNFPTAGNDAADRNMMALYRKPMLHDIVLISTMPLSVAALGCGETLQSIAALESFKSQPCMIGIVTDDFHGQCKVMFSINQWAKVVEKINIPETDISDKSADTPYLMYYFVIGNMRSSWKAFHALLELNEFQTPLLKCILSGGNDHLFHSSVPSSSKSSSSSSTSSISISAPDNNTSAMQSLHSLRGISRSYINYLQSVSSPSQLHAVASACNRSKQRGFTVIHGLVATGKTSTLLHILNTLHLHNFNDFYQPLLHQMLFTNEGRLCGQMCPNPTPWAQLASTHILKKPRILILAPSTSSVTHFAKQLVKRQFMDSLGNKYQPKFVFLLDEKDSTKNIIHEEEEVLKKFELMELVRKESLANLPVADKRNHLQTLVEKLNEMVPKLTHLQTMLVNLSIAFQLHFPLPPHWELRVNHNSALPYWVNHKLRMSTYDPPIAEIQAFRGAHDYKDVKMPFPFTAEVSIPFCPASCPYPSLHLLPEYKLFSHQLIKSISSFHQQNRQRIRMEEVLGCTDRQLYLMEEYGHIPASCQDMIAGMLLSDTDMIVTTIENCVNPLLECVDFDVIMVDDATDCTEPSMLLALSKCQRHCILAGDTQQYSPSTYSKLGKQQGYDISLFERLIKANHPTLVLEEQYRMIPKLSAFPSRVFYGNRLQHSAMVRESTYLPFYCRQVKRQPQLIENNSIDSNLLAKLLFPVMFFNLMKTNMDQSVDDDLRSDHDKVECEVLEQLLLLINHYIQSCFHENDKNYQKKNQQKVEVGVIVDSMDSIASTQKVISELQVLLDATGEEVVNITCNVASGFQGKECDMVIIVLSSNSSSSEESLVTNARMFNVALTRSKYALYVIGTKPTKEEENQSSSYYWRQWVDYMSQDDSDAIVDIDVNDVKDLVVKDDEQDNFAAWDLYKVLKKHFAKKISNTVVEERIQTHGAVSSSSSSSRTTTEESGDALLIKNEDQSIDV